MVKIHMMKAQEGDFIWLSYGDMEKEHHLLIDGGVKDCRERYADVVRFISAKGESIEAIILTHIDCDHIAGACEGIAKVDAGILQRTVKKIIFNASKKIHKEILVSKNSGEYGVKEGIEFCEILKEKGIYDRIVERTIAGEIINLANGALLKVISPGEKQLEKLLDKWESYEKKQLSVGYSPNLEKVKQNLADLMRDKSGIDSSVNNASSIALLFEYQNIKGAFLGDAKPSICMEGMKEFDIKDVYPVDFVKLSHHGSIANTNLKLLKKLPTVNYLLSTNGHEKKVPSKVVIAKLLRNCQEENKPEIMLYCNYDWWESQYHNKYFTQKDRQLYIDTGVLKINLLGGEGTSVKDGLILYGK